MFPSICYSSAASSDSQKDGQIIPKSPHKAKMFLLSENKRLMFRDSASASASAVIHLMPGFFFHLFDSSVEYNARHNQKSNFVRSFNEVVKYVSYVWPHNENHK